VTGSIGVFNLWLHTRGFYEKLGINKDIFLRGERADIFPTWREVTEEDLELTQYYVDEYYDKFVNDVAEGRAMSVEQVNGIGRGRVWSGKRAREIGLVDRIGGLSEAIRLAKQEAGIAADENVDFKILPQQGGFLASLRRAMGAKVTEDLGIPEEVRDLLGDATYLSAYDEPILYLMPYRLEVK
jgi:protease-4